MEIDKVEEHQPCKKLRYRLPLLINDIAVLLFLFFRCKEKFQPAMLIELYEARLVISINYEKATARLVSLRTEPCLHVVQDLAPDVQVLIATVYAKTSKKHGGKILPRLFCFNICSYHIASAPGDMACKNAGVGQSDARNDTFWRTVAEKVGLSKQLPLISLYIVVEEIVDVLTATVELLDTVSWDITQRKPKAVINVHTDYFLRLS